MSVTTSPSSSRHPQSGPLPTHLAYKTYDAKEVSGLTDWRRQRDAGAFHALSPSKRGPRTAVANPLARLLAQRERENAILARRLARAETIIDLQKSLGPGVLLRKGT